MTWSFGLILPWMSATLPSTTFFTKIPQRLSENTIIIFVYWGRMLKFYRNQATMDAATKHDDRVANFDIGWMCRWYLAFNLDQKSYLFHKYIPPQWGRGPTCPSPARPWRARAGPPGCPRCPLTRRRWPCWPAPAASPGSPGSRSRGWSSAWPGQVMSVNIQILS